MFRIKSKISMQVKQELGSLRRYSNFSREKLWVCFVLDELEVRAVLVLGSLEVQSKERRHLKK